MPWAGKGTSQPSALMRMEINRVVSFLATIGAVLLTTTSYCTVQHASATTSTPSSSAEICLLESAACYDDGVCWDCVAQFVDAADCAERYPVLADEGASDCEVDAAILCCSFDASVEDCLGDAVTMDYFQCGLDESGCTPSDTPCSGDGSPAVSSTSTSPPTPTPSYVADTDPPVNPPTLMPMAPPTPTPREPASPIPSTAVPVDAPTLSPVAPTPAPVIPPTPAPVVPPTDSPVPVPTMQIVFTTPAPTVETARTPTPVEAATDSPVPVPTMQIAFTTPAPTVETARTPTPVEAAAILPTTVIAETIAPLTQITNMPIPSPTMPPATPTMVPTPEPTPTMTPRDTSDAIIGPPDDDSSSSERSVDLATPSPGDVDSKTTANGAAEAPTRVLGVYSMMLVALLLL